MKVKSLNLKFRMHNTNANKKSKNSMQHEYLNYIFSNEEKTLKQVYNKIKI